jgi:hypothetical protein
LADALVDDMLWHRYSFSDSGFAVEASEIL